MVLIMMIWFKCEEEGLLIGLETDAKPAIGDTIRIKKICYKRGEERL